MSACCYLARSEPVDQLPAEATEYMPAGVESLARTIVVEEADTSAGMDVNVSAEEPPSEVEDVQVAVAVSDAVDDSAVGTESEPIVDGAVADDEETPRSYAEVNGKIAEGALDTNVVDDQTVNEILPAGPVDQPSAESTVPDVAEQASTAAVELAPTPEMEQVADRGVGISIEPAVDVVEEQVAEADVAAEPASDIVIGQGSVVIDGEGYVPAAAEVSNTAVSAVAVFYICEHCCLCRWNTDIRTFCLCIPSL